MEKKKILVVDDEEGITTTFKLLIEKAGEYEVRSVTQGSRAIDAAKQFGPDLVLLDIMMPDVDGGEVARQLKADEKTRHIPVVFVSAAITREEAKRKDSIRGGYPIIAKPVPTEELMRTIEKYIGGGKKTKGVADAPSVKGKKAFPYVERRRHRRVPTGNLLSYICMDENDGPLEEGIGNVLNISQGGILVETHLPIRSESLRLTATNIKNGLIDIRGKVIYSRMPEPDVYHTGINFIGSYENIRGFVVQLIKFFNLEKDR